MMAVPLSRSRLRAEAGCGVERPCARDGVMRFDVRRADRHSSRNGPARLAQEAEGATAAASCFG